MTKKHRLNLALPEDLWKRFQKLAARNRRSTTQEIIVAMMERLEREEKGATK